MDLFPPKIRNLSKLLLFQIQAKPWGSPGRGPSQGLEEVSSTTKMNLIHMALRFVKEMIVGMRLNGRASDHAAASCISAFYLHFPCSGPWSGGPNSLSSLQRCFLPAQSSPASMYWSLPCLQTLLIYLAIKYIRMIFLSDNLIRIE